MADHICADSTVLVTDDTGRVIGHRQITLAETKALDAKRLVANSELATCRRDSRRLIYPASCDECRQVGECLALLPEEVPLGQRGFGVMEKPDA